MALNHRMNVERKMKADEEESIGTHKVSSCLYTLVALVCLCCHTFHFVSLSRNLSVATKHTYSFVTDVIMNKTHARDAKDLNDETKQNGITNGKQPEHTFISNN